VHGTETKKNKEKINKNLVAQKKTAKAIVQFVKAVREEEVKLYGASRICETGRF